MTYLTSYHRTDNALAVPPARYFHRAGAWCDVLVYLDGDAGTRDVTAPNPTTERSTMSDMLPLLSADWIGATVSADTLRPDDLARAAARVLQSSEPHAYIGADLLAALDDAERRGDAEGVLMVADDAFRALETFAPAGTFFGTLEGDGACFGFWGACDASEECQCTDCSYFRRSQTRYLAATVLLVSCQCTDCSYFRRSY